MRILREHDTEIEKIGGYTCMRCLVKDHGNPYMDNCISRVYNEIFTDYAWPGSYTILFTTDNGDIFCANCAKKVFSLEKEDITCNTYDEGPTLNCDVCNREIESSYGDPEEAVKE